MRKNQYTAALNYSAAAILEEMGSEIAASVVLKDTVIPREWMLMALDDKVFAMQLSPEKIQCILDNCIEVETDIDYWKNEPVETHGYLKARYSFGNDIENLIMREMHWMEIEFFNGDIRFESIERIFKRRVKFLKHRQ